MYSKQYSSRSIPKGRQAKLQSLKKKVQRSLDHDSDNFEYFNRMKRFICDTTLDEETRETLRVLQKPVLECNEIEHYINSQLADTLHAIPSIQVTPSSTITDPVYKGRQEKTAEVIEGWLRYKLSPRETNSAQYELNADLYRGGLSAAMLKIDWKHDDPYDFDTDILFEKEPYPTMCGWDPAAVESHRGDGKYCYKIFAYTKDQAQERFGADTVAKISPQFGISGFSWSYYQDGEPYYLFCEFYDIETKAVTTAQLSNGTVIKKADYKDFVTQWENENFDDLAPVIVRERRDYVHSIWQYIFNETTMISCSETDYKYLPLVRFEAAVTMEDTRGANKRSMCRSFVHNLVDVQRLKNTAMQGVAFEIENTMTHKMMMEYSTVIPEQTDQLINNQVPNVILWQSKPNRQEDPNETYPQPQIVARPPVPAIIEQTYLNTSTVMDKVMGAMDQRTMGKGNIAHDTLQSAYVHESKISYPYKQAYLQGINRCCTILMDLIPKVFRTPTSLPVVTRDGKRAFISINQPQDPHTIMMDFRPKDFNVEIAAGPNSEVLKQVGMNQVVELSRTFKGFNQFIDQECKDDLIENLDIKNKGSMEMKLQAWKQKQQQIAARAVQNPPADPVQAQLQIESAKIAERQQESQLDAEVKAAQLQMQNRKLDIDLIKALSKVKTDEMNNLVKQAEIHAEDVRSAAMAAAKLAQHQSETRRYHHEKKDMATRTSSEGGE